jgi:hypothetical protein
VGDEDVIQTPGKEDRVGLRLRREQVEFVNEVPGHFGALEIHLLIRPGDVRDHQIERRDAVWKSRREDDAGGTWLSSRCRTQCEECGRARMKLFAERSNAFGMHQAPDSRLHHVPGDRCAVGAAEYGEG